MKLDRIEHIDYFEGATIFWADLSEAPQELQDLARALDGSEYDPMRFGMCIHHDVATGEWSVVTDTDLSTGENCNVFYIDKEGDKYWFKADLTQDFVLLVFMECKRAAVKSNGDPMEGSCPIIDLPKQP